MLDLKSQYERIKEDIDNAMQEVIDNTAFINGPQVKQFQKELAEYMGVGHVITCGNGTDALQIAMMALGLKPGDEVITADFTFIATVEVIGLLGLKPVLVDVDKDHFTLNLDAVRKAITSKTRAIVPVHLFGQSAHMHELMQLAEEHDLYLIEDAAQATGCDYMLPDGSKKKAGTLGHMGCTSFFPSKNLGCYGDGGAIFTDDDTLAEKAYSIVNHGSRKKYYHDRIGVNSRLDTIQAAVLRAKLPHLDAYNAARQKAAGYYNNAFANSPHIITPKEVDWSAHIYHQYTLKIIDTDRNALMEYLKAHGVPCAVYYPVPLHQQKAFQGFSYVPEDYPVTDMLINQVVSLPMHTELSEDQLVYITNTVLDFFRK